jgi:hypothetical protein
VSVPGRYQLLEAELPPEATGGCALTRVAVKLFKRTATLRVDMELGEAPGGGAAAEAAAAGAQQQQRDAAAPAGPPRVVDLWVSAEQAAAAAAAGAPGLGRSLSVASSSSEAAGGGLSGASSDSGGLPAGVAAAASALASLQSLHTSVSETDLFMLGLHATARAQKVLKRLSGKAPPRAPAVAVGGAPKEGGA